MISKELFGKLKHIDGQVLRARCWRQFPKDVLTPRDICEAHMINTSMSTYRAEAKSDNAGVVLIGRKGHLGVHHQALGGALQGRWYGESVSGEWSVLMVEGAQT
jgi:hypothetical protein